MEMARKGNIELNPSGSRKEYQELRVAWIIRNIAAHDNILR